MRYGQDGRSGVEIAYSLGIPAAPDYLTGIDTARSAPMAVAA
jgi:hypothetical protein